MSGPKATAAAAVLIFISRMRRGGERRSQEIRKCSAGQ